MGVIDGGREVEKELHRRFRDLHVRGEWHRDEPVLRAYIEGLLSTGQASNGHHSLGCSGLEWSGTRVVGGMMDGAASTETIAGGA